MSAGPDLYDAWGWWLEFNMGQRRWRNRITMQPIAGCEKPGEARQGDSRVGRCCFAVNFSFCNTSMLVLSGYRTNVSDRGGVKINTKVSQDLNEEHQEESGASSEFLAL